MLADEDDQVIRFPRWRCPISDLVNPKWICFAFMLLACGCPKQGMAQVSVKAETLTKWHGFIAAKVLPDGVVVADPASKPFAKTETTYSLVVEPGFVLEDLAVEKKPSLDFVTVEPGLITLPAGEYRATARLTKDGKPVTQRFNFTIGDVKPEPPKPDDPDPPKPDVPVKDEYGVGLAAYKNAPDAATSKSYAKVYKRAGDSLFALNGEPLRAISSDNASDAANPKRNVIAFLNEQLTGAKPEFKAAMKKAFEDSQTKRQFKKEDWYNAFNEVAEALEAVK